MIAAVWPIVEVILVVLAVLFTVSFALFGACVLAGWLLRRRAARRAADREYRQLIDRMGRNIVDRRYFVRTKDVG